MVIASSMEIFKWKRITFAKPFLDCDWNPQRDARTNTGYLYIQIKSHFAFIHTEYAIYGIDAHITLINIEGIPLADMREHLTLRKNVFDLLVGVT